MEESSATNVRAPGSLAPCQAIPEVPVSSPSGPIGLAVGRSAYRLTMELVEATRSAAAELGIQARIVGPLDDRTGLRTLLGIGFQRDFLAVLDAGRNDHPGCPSIVWVGEPLLPLGETSGSLAARLGRSPLLDLARLPLRPLRGVRLPRPLARVRGEMVGEWERYRNALDLDRAARFCDQLVVTNRVAAATLARRGLSASVVPWGYAAAMAGEILPPDMGDRDLAIVALGRTDAWVAWRRRETHQPPILWVDDQAAFEPGLPVLPAIGSVRRREIMRRLVGEGRQLATLIHPSAVVSPTAVVEPGCVVCPLVVVGAYSRIGEGTILNRGSLLGHHTEVGGYSFLGPGANVAGMVTLGEQVYVGAGAIIRDHVRVGDRAVVGMGAAVVKDVPADVTVVGVPARPQERSVEAGRP